MPKILQRPADPGIAPRRVLLGHPHHQPPNLRDHTRTTGPALRVRPFAGDHCRCHRRMVSGVTIVATWPNSRRPSRCPHLANRHRSSSVSRSRRPRSGARRIRFSSIKYSTASCRWPLHQPATDRSTNRSAATSTTAGVYMIDRTSTPTRRLRSGIIRSRIQRRASPGIAAARKDGDGS